MTRSDTHLSETDIRSPNARQIAVRAHALDRRPWLLDAPLCEPLDRRQILHVGVACMPAPFEIVRLRLGGSYFLACLSGEGSILVDGRWTPCHPNHAFLLPPGTLHAFHTPEGGSWEFCWVRYAERPGHPPLTLAHSPVLARYEATPLRHAILGLHADCSQGATGPMIDRWVDLVHCLVDRFAQPAALDPRIAAVWNAVAANLASDWSIAQLARAAHLSEKQFQRLCRRDLGRSPQAHLMWLRMRRAAELLTTTDQKIAAIAAAVGYENAFVFSSTFKRIMGWSPSSYPGRK